MIMTGIVMTADPIERRIERVKENPREGMKGATITLQNELHPGIKTSVARILRGTVNLNAHHKRHVLMSSSRFGQSLQNVRHFLLSSDGHSICGARRHSCGGVLEAKSGSGYPDRGGGRNGCYHCRRRLHDGHDGSRGLRLH